VLHALKDVTPPAYLLLDALASLSFLGLVGKLKDDFELLSLAHVDDSNRVVVMPADEFGLHALVYFSGWKLKDGSTDLVLIVWYFCGSYHPASILQVDVNVLAQIWGE
jgi:hypothetical protein